MFKRHFSGLFRIIALQSESTEDDQQETRIRFVFAIENFPIEGECSHHESGFSLWKEFARIDKSQLSRLITFRLLRKLFLLKNEERLQWFIFRCFWRSLGPSQSPMHLQSSSRVFTISSMRMDHWEYWDCSHSSRSIYGSQCGYIYLRFRENNLLGRLPTNSRSKQWQKLRKSKHFLVHACRRHSSHECTC